MEKIKLADDAIQEAEENKATAKAEAEERLEKRYSGA